jgi:single-strand DNA-binding protein
MNSVNKVILLGNAGKDAEVSYLKNDATVARFTVATNESYKDKNGEKQTRTEWHNVEVWGETAKFVGNKLKKGSLVYVEGKIKTEEFEKKNKEGQKVRATKIVAYDVQVQNKESKNENSNNSPSEQVNEYATSGAPQASAQFATNLDQGDDLPF